MAQWRNLSLKFSKVFRGTQEISGRPEVRVLTRDPTRMSAGFAACCVPKAFYLSCCKASNIVSLTPAFPEKGVGMQITRTIMFGVLMVFLASGEPLAQAISEYGKTVEGVGQRQGRASPKASRSPSRNAKGKAVVQGIGDTGGRPIPSGLVVMSKQIGLYPRQDDAAETIAELHQGDTLIPMMQSNSGNDWYMVKTQQGVIGWVKAVDVREDTGKKQ
jgi:hypothetical protein